MINRKITYFVLMLLFVGLVSAISYNDNVVISQKTFENNDYGMMRTKIDIKNNLNVSSDDFDNLSRGQEMRFYMSNGRYANIKMMPATASAKALTIMEANCEERNCTVELKESGSGNNTRTVYEVQAQKNARLFGFIKMKMNVKSEVDAETGDVVKINKPWWAKLAVEEDSQVKL